MSFLARIFRRYHDDEAWEEEPDWDEAIPAGPAYLVNCQDTATDFVRVRAGDVARVGPIVGVDMCSNGAMGGIILTPRDARAFAAGILNAADDADGLTPLLYVGQRRDD